MGWTDKPAKFFAVYSVHDSNDRSRELVSSFAKQGDSGSWLVDIMGRLIAMLHTGLPDGHDSLAFGTPLKDTFEQTERKTDFGTPSNEMDNKED